MLNFSHFIVKPVLAFNNTENAIQSFLIVGTVTGSLNVKEIEDKKHVKNCTVILYCHDNLYSSTVITQDLLKNQPEKMADRETR